MKYALIIGNTVYRDSKLAQLKTPESDSVALANVLADNNIGSFDQVIQAVNKSVNEVRIEIGSFFSDKQRDDLLLLYFSGHGVLDERGRLFLALTDTQTGLLRATSVSSSFISDEMDRCRSKRQILILDCCNSGAFERGTKGVRKSVTESTFKGNGYGHVVLTATDSTQYAFEGNRVIPQSDLSLFTHFLISGMRTGEADLDDDGYISLDELYEYTYEKTISVTPNQLPQKWSYHQQGNLIVAKNLQHEIKRRELAEKVAREKAEKEAAEKVQLVAEEKARQKAAKEKADREAAEKAARERAEQEAAEKARLEAEEQARQKAAKEKAEREAVEKAAREKKEREQREVAEKAKAEELYKKTNSALQFEWNQDFENALKVYYEIKNIDPTYPNVETKINELEKEIQVRQEKSRREAEEQARQKVVKEKTEHEAADKIAREKAEKEAAERARLVAEERARQRTAKEKADREAAEKVARRKAEIEEKFGMKAQAKAMLIFAGTFFAFAVIAVFVSMTGNSFSKNIPSTPSVTQHAIVESTFTSSPIVSTKTITPSETATQTPLPTSLPNEITDAKGVQMVLVPEGEFTMGTNIDTNLPECGWDISWPADCQSEPDEEPEHKVFLDSYYMDKYEVTNNLYAICVEDGVCDPPPIQSLTSEGVRVDYYGNSEFGDYPVIFINWYMAKDYCEWRNAHLPSEAQWEKTARGISGKNSNFWDRSNGYFVYSHLPSKVGQYETDKSPYRAYDMIGNVIEWVYDWYDKNYYKISNNNLNPFGPDSGATRVVRGADFWNFRPSNRNYVSPNTTDNRYVGFRCARSVP